MAKKKNKKIKKISKPKEKESSREKMIGQHIGYWYDVNLLPDYKKITPFLKKYVEKMAAYIKYDNEPLEKTESVSSNEEEPQPTKISETLENQLPNEKTIEHNKKRTYQKILDEENGPRKLSPEQNAQWNG